jgi:hypothetical protein
MLSRERRSADQRQSVSRASRISLTRSECTFVNASSPSNGPPSSLRWRVASKSFGSIDIIGRGQRLVSALFGELEEAAENRDEIEAAIEVETEDDDNGVNKRRTWTPPKPSANSLG